MTRTSAPSDHVTDAMWMAIRTSAAARQWGSGCVRSQSTSVPPMKFLYVRSKARR